MTVSKSEYQISLQILLTKYSIFQNSLTSYAASYSLQNKRLQNLVSLWCHPEAIANLVLSLSLQKKPKLRLNHFQKQERMIEYGDDKMAEMSNLELDNEQSNYESLKEDLEVNDCNDSSNIKEEQEELLAEDFDAQLSINDDQYRSEKEGSRNYKRGPYKSYTVQEKERAVKLLLGNELTISEISRLLKIPCKNIKRWSVEGVCRKRGGHRRSCPEMQKNVFNWIIFNHRQGSEIIMLDIQNYALSISQDAMFKASRGWMLKFIERYKIKGLYTFR